MRKCENHRIFIENLNDEDHIPHSVVLIRGKVPEKCSKQDIEATLCDRTIRQEVDQNGQFKLLLRLNPGENHINLVYCKVNQSLTLLHHPKQQQKLIQPLYLICQNDDGNFQSDSEPNDPPEAAKRINLALELIQTLFAEKLNDRGFGRRTFQLARCLPFHIALRVHELYRLTEEQLWTAVAKEILTSPLASRHTKYVAFISCTRFEGLSDGDRSYANIKRRLKGSAALGGGGLALFGTACLYTWPSHLADVQRCFQSREPIDVTRLCDDSNYRGTRGGCFSTTLGSVCHELGHCFDLGHTADGIMGNGFDYSGRVFTVPRLTEALPDRIVGRKETRAEARATATPRFTRVRNQGEFLAKYHEQKGRDLTYFSENCLVTLAFHPWLNDETGDGDGGGDEIRFEAGKIRSKSSPLRLVEVRDSGDGMMRQFWTFLDANVYAFSVPNDAGERTTIVAVSAGGAILKREIGAE